MTLGAERKKIMWLAGLIVLAPLAYWFSSSSDAPPPSSAPRPAADPSGAITAPVGSTSPKSVVRRTPSGHANIGDPNIKLPDNVDPTKTDPTIRLDLLAKVQGVGEEGGVRNIFLIGTPPPAEPVATANNKIPKVDPLHPNAPPPPPGPKPLTPQPSPPGPPPPAPLTLKYYGYSKRTDGERKAFFLDGDEIIVAAEGEIIKKQYKVVSITVTTVQMEDTVSKSTQTLVIQQEPAPV